MSDTESFHPDQLLGRAPRTSHLLNSSYDLIPFF